MTFEEYRKYDALGLAELIQKKDIHPTKLLEIAIERLETVNPKINAVVHKLYDYAKEMLQKHPSDAAFSGIPLLIKDLGLHIKGTPCNVGSRSLKDFISPEDSFAVRQLRKAGFIFFGKTNTPEFGLTPFTEPIIYGTCHNPWNLKHSPGGSSGGSGAAVASGIVPLATASDGGGSIRIPAACCGLLGFKASRGNTSFRPYGSEFWGGLVVEGCNSRTVRDTAAYLDAIAGMDLGEPYLTQVSQQNFSQQLEEPVPKLKIGWTTQHPLGLSIDTACQKAIEHTAQLLQSLGHQVKEVPPPYQREDITETFVTIVASECAGDFKALEAFLGKKVSRSEIEPNSWGLRVLGQTFKAEEYAYARQQMGQLAYRMGQWHEQYDILLTPVLSERPIKTGALQNTKAEASLVSLINTFGLGKLLRANMNQFVDKAFGYIPFTPLANMTGQPSMSVPLYWTEENLPVGSMLTAKMGDDALLLRLAKQLEEAQPWFDKVPAL